MWLWGQMLLWLYVSVSLSLHLDFKHQFAIAVCSNVGTSKVNVPKFAFTYTSTKAHNFQKKYQVL